MVRVCVGRVVQDDRLGEIPPEDAEIFDVVAENAGAVVLIQTMSTGEIKHVNNIYTRFCEQSVSL